MQRFVLMTALILAWSAAGATKVVVPVDVGLGPAAYVFTGPVFADQPIHFGLKLSVAAIIDQQLIRQHEGRIPPRYRQMARGVKEIRITPSLLIPDSLIISPQWRNTGIYGVTWRPLSLGIPFGDGAVRLRLGAGLLLTYAFLHSTVLPTTHFIRPGADLKAEVEVAFSPSFLLSFGWSSGFYIPQQLGEFGLGPLDQSIWHVGQGFLLFHVRFPYETRI